MIYLNAKNNARYGKIDNPIREALTAITGKIPPQFVKGYNFESLTDDQFSKLQDFCSENARPDWATGLSIMNAAEIIVEQAIENANIQQEGEL